MSLREAEKYKDLHVVDLYISHQSIVINLEVKNMKNVKVYSTPTCGFCVRVKQFLKDNSVDFEEIDISLDPESAKVIVEKSGQMGVPVLDIEGEIIVGFDKDKISQALGL